MTNRPAGDDVLNGALLAAPSYGCVHTNNKTDMDDGKNVVDLRVKIAASAACAAK